MTEHNQPEDFQVWEHTNGLLPCPKVYESLMEAYRESVSNGTGIARLEIDANNNLSAQVLTREQVDSIRERLNQEDATDEGER